MSDQECLALVFGLTLAGNRAALAPAAQSRLPPAGRILLRVLVDMPAVVRELGLEQTTVTWRRLLLRAERSELIGTPSHYAAALRVARAADGLTAAQLARVVSPEALLDGQPHSSPRASSSAKARRQ